jgi:hypothetical protein
VRLQACFLRERGHSYGVTELAHMAVLSTGNPYGIGSRSVRSAIIETSVTEYLGRCVYISQRCTLSLRPDEGLKNQRGVETRRALTG